MHIAPGVLADEWKNLDFASPDAWATGIAIFERRIRGRFTDAVDFLISDDKPRPPTERRWGFAVLAIDCLLVETIEAFRQGLTNTKGKSKDLSVKFLTERPAFKGFFTQDIATRFYYEFRCGMAHNAQVFGNGLVWSVGALLSVDNGRITVNRTAFHQALLAELKTYLGELSSGTDVSLRSNFKTKMDFVAEGKFQ